MKSKTPPKKASAIKQRALKKIQNYLASDIPTRKVTFAEEKRRRDIKQNTPKKPKKMPKGTPKPKKNIDYSLPLTGPIVSTSGHSIQQHRLLDAMMAAGLVPVGPKLSYMEIEM